MRKSRPRINVFNRQRKIRVETLPLKDFLERMTDSVAPGAAFSLVLLSDRAMRRYNRDFRGYDQTTDVLSFPCREEGEEDPYRGDILISVERAERQRESPLLEELKRLALHGFLHLLGYDHQSDEGQMERLERKWRRELQLP